MAVKCEHEKFDAKVQVARLCDPGIPTAFVAEITIKCAECGANFEFQGLQPGVDTQGATVSIDGQEARIAICPPGTKPNPFQRMQFNIKRLG